jgi:hypothetical protein
MRIIIKGIYATLIDASTLSGSNYIIQNWIAEYEVYFLKQNHTEVQGKIVLNHPPTVDELLAHIKWLFEPMEDRFKAEKIEFK